ncbi:hypothetical protein ACTG9Q_15795 [Actinokineospora sp. 24-640]
MACPGPRPAPPGDWWFDGHRVHSASGSFTPYAVEFHQRWTFARFLPGGALALAFESGQPWSEHGSHGSRLGGVEVLSWTGVDWDLVALEYDEREHDEEFVPDDVVWHPRGVLAWLRDGLLYAHQVAGPRLAVGDPCPTRDSAGPLVFSMEVAGPWQRLELGRDGRELIAGRGRRTTIINLELGVPGD